MVILVNQGSLATLDLVYLVTAVIVEQELVGIQATLEVEFQVIVVTVVRKVQSVSQVSLDSQVLQVQLQLQVIQVFLEPVDTLVIQVKTV